MVKIIYCKNKTKLPLNKVTLLENLEKYFTNQTDINVNELSNYIFDNRKIKELDNIKRK